MKNNKGFISMSVIYSFFMIFIAVTAVILANYTHNRLLIKEINKDIKYELSNAGAAKLAQFTNLLKNGDMEENLAWIISDTSTMSYNTQNFHSSSRSFELRIPTANKTVTLTQNISPSIIPGHTYYLQYYTYAPWTSKGSSSTISLNNTNGNQNFPFTGISTFGTFSSWQTQGSILTIPTTANASGTWRLIISETNKIGSPIYLDDFILIDLTAAVGNDLPPLDWLKNNIQYFEGTATYNRTYSNDHITS